MVISSNDSYLDNLLTEVERFFGGARQKPVAAPRQRSIAPSTGYQAPIKSQYYSSGAYSPNKATDARHAKGHKGVDLRAAGGTAIYPIAPGVVTYVGPDPSGGNVVNIQHANGVRSYYAHLGTIRVQRGNRVNNNSVIATVGDSGNAKGTWPHLHIQVWKDNQLQNPGDYFHVPVFTQPDTSKEKFWASDRAKQMAHSFNVGEHISRRVASKSDELLKLASEYEELCFKF